MRGGLVLVVFLLVFAGATYFLLNQKGLLGGDGVELLWNFPEPAVPVQRERVDAAPLAMLLKEELADVERAKLDLEREREQFAAERDALDQQRDTMATELEAVQAYREAQETQRVANVQAVSRMLANMDAAAAAQILDELPEELARTFANRDYYGTLSHNSKAVYQMYFGWFDGNPANLDPLPPEQAGVRYVAAMGGAAAVLEKARAAYDEGEYRWVGSLLNHLVFADPENRAARSLLADAYDQMGYQAESGPWRDFYLTGARELREGVGEFPLHDVEPPSI